MVLCGISDGASVDWKSVLGLDAGGGLCRWWLMIRQAEGGSYTLLFRAVPVLDHYNTRSLVSASLVRIGTRRPRLPFSKHSYANVSRVVLSRTIYIYTRYSNIDYVVKGEDDG